MAKKRKKLQKSNGSSIRKKVKQNEIDYKHILENAKKRILILGCADFSWILSLISIYKKHKAYICATSFDSLNTLRSKYGNKLVLDNIQELKEEDVKVLHEIDATDIDVEKVLKKENKLFHRIIFNYP